MPKTQMLINYVPGEECRVAMAEDGKLEDFEAERTDAVSRVGNIYAGVVANVEPSIQAAFVDFGVEQHGFLHVTDVHPMFFPGEDEETRERVGKKTPRRERPPIQQCLKRGQRIVVQVLKEGVGTKGPTLTSYLSIPGRYLVMMPQMDRVGVSRKVEDEDQRRKMREILDQLDLPSEFGFILRTAGLERNKTELKRDLAYLQRLWDDMEKRRKDSKKPHVLYCESDLLVRNLRDNLTSDVDEVVIDDPRALERASRFLKIVAPRTRTKLMRYTGTTPLFHAFGIEQQIAAMHAREVDLPSGGRLVFDETEALVAIDVNSGKSRSAKDAETNAYKTNLEAVDEICRQLRLRDLGGLVICELIDMRETRHRRKIESRFRERLKRDRARSTILPISSFGILEMTRQRVRGSHESQHFAECPTCTGRGLVQRPDSLTADALRRLAAIILNPKVSRVEMVVSPRVASELLSHKRRSLSRIERISQKHVDVRASETIPISRVDFYAYDAGGADLSVDKILREPRSPEDLESWDKRPASGEDWAVDLQEEAEQIAAEQTAEPEEEVEEVDRGITDFDLESDEAADAEAQPKKKRRRRRRGRGRGKQSEAQQEAGETESSESTAAESDTPSDSESSDDASSESPKPRSKRKRSRRKKTTTKAAEESTDQKDQQESADSQPDADAEPSDSDQPVTKKKRRRRRRGGGGGSKSDAAKSESTEPTAESASSDPAPESTDDAEGTATKRKTKRRRRRKSTSESTSDATSNGQPAPAAETPAEPAKPKGRSLYGAGRRRLKASERTEIARDE